MKKLTMDKLRLRIAMALACFGVICIVSPILLGQTALYHYRVTALPEYKNADEALTATYARLSSMTDSRGKERLEVTQRVWARFRDAQCKFESSQAKTPEAKAAAYSSAHERLTQLRIASLHAQIGEIVQTQSVAPACAAPEHHCPSN